MPTRITPWMLAIVMCLTPLALADAPNADAEAAPGAAEQVDARADKLLQEASQALADLKHFSVQITYDTQMSGPLPNGIPDTKVVQEISFDRFDRAAVILKQGQAGGSFVTDGKKAFLTYPVRQGYVEMEAPQSLDELRLQATQAGGGAAMGLNLVLPEGDIYASIMKMHPQLRYVDQQKIGETDCDHLKLVVDNANANNGKSLMPGFPIKKIAADIWLTADDDHMVARVDVDITELLQMMWAGASKANSDLKKVTGVMTAQFDHWQIDPKFPADRFTFVPPAGEKKYSSLGELFGMGAGGKTEHPLLNKPAPDFELSLLSGGKVKLADHRDKDIVVLDFWATWCGPCVVALPKVSRIANQFKDQHVVFYAVNLSEDPDTINAFLKQKQLDVPVLLGDKQIGETYGAKAIPQTMIIGKDGVVRHVHVGYTAEEEKQLEQELSALVAQDAAPTP